MTPELHAPGGRHAGPRGSCFANAEAAEAAVQAALPSIEAMLQQPAVSGQGVLALVVMDPALHWHDAPFDTAVLLEHTVGPREGWDVDYLALARAKAQLAWRHGADSAAVHTARAHLLKEGDSVLDGGVWLDGIVVAASGAMPWYDEAFALSVAAHFRAAARQRRAECHGLTARGATETGARHG